MEEKLGVIKTEDEKRTPIYLTGLLSIILIATFIFTLKNYEPAKNIILTGGILIYPFTFLILSFISKYYGFKAARKTTFISTLVYISFFLIIMLGVLPASNAATSGYNTLIQYFFTNSSFKIGSATIYYPIIGQFLSVLVSYFVSHLLFATIYNAVNRFTVDYLAMGLSLFIAYILDRLIFMPILFFSGLIDKSNSFDYLIKCLTSEFIASIMITILLIIIYIIFTSIRNSLKKHN